jgi:hypothetical protein
MANTFNPVIEYKDIIDRFYERADKTNVFMAPEEYTTNGEYKILKVSVGGLGNYNRNRTNGQTVAYAGNSISTSWETIASDQQRSTQLFIDKADNLEAFSAAFDEAIFAFLQKAVVERMARRHAAIASSTSGITKEVVDVSTAEKTVAALRHASDILFDNHVYEDNRVTLIRGDVYSALADMDTYKSKAVLAELGQIIPLTSDVMYDKIVLDPANGYAPADDANEIAFMIVQRDAVVSGTHWEANFFDEGQVQNFRGSLYNYFEDPLNGYVYENKAKGVYVGILAGEGGETGETE